MIKAISVLTALATSVLGAAPASKWVQAVPIDAKLPGSRNLSFRCSGEGQPTVILESGLGGDSTGWEKLQKILEKKHRVCSYDRAGSGLSDPGPTPRDADAIASDLNEGLKWLGITRPVILVGHSAGAIFCRRFTEIYPKKVIAMVLVDPSVEYQDKRFAAKFGAGAGGVGAIRAKLLNCLRASEEGKFLSDSGAINNCIPPSSEHPDESFSRRVAIASNPRAIDDKISELDNLWDMSSDEVSSGYQISQRVPVAVLTADGTYSNLPSPVREEVAQFWLQLHLETASHYKSSIALIVANSSHLIMNDQPEAVSLAIDAILKRALFH